MCCDRVSLSLGAVAKMPNPGKCLERGRQLRRSLSAISGVNDDNDNYRGHKQKDEQRHGQELSNSAKSQQRHDINHYQRSVNNVTNVIGSGGSSSSSTQSTKTTTLTKNYCPLQPSKHHHNLTNNNNRSFHLPTPHNRTRDLDSLLEPGQQEYCLGGKNGVSSSRANVFSSSPSSLLSVKSRSKERHRLDSCHIDNLTRGGGGQGARSPVTSIALFACVVMLLINATSLAQLVTTTTTSTNTIAAAAAATSDYGSLVPTTNGGDNVESAATAATADNSSWRSKPASMRDLRDARLGDKLTVNMSNVFEVIFKKRPYSKYWSVEQKWDDLFKRLMAVQGPVQQMMMKNFMRDIEYYADLTISPQCEKDLKYIQNYARQSTNFRWLAHMFDSTGKSEPGMLTGMLANLGHPVQCIKVRAPARPSNDSFDERFFEQQTEALGERFRGKYCVASLRPVMPKKPRLVSRFSEIMNSTLLSNISYSGEPIQVLKMRAHQLSIPASAHQLIDRAHLRLDQIPFESELYEYLIAQRNFMFTLPRFMGVCYPSSCTRDDVRMSLQKTLDDQHQVVDMEFECEQEEVSAWDFFITPRLLTYVLLGLIVSLVFIMSFVRYILLSKMQIRRSRLAPDSRLANLLNVLDMFSMDKCAGILFIKTKRASPIVDWTRVENNRSTAIDALKGFLMLLLVYSQLTVLGCLPVPFMWSKWSDAMFPFFRSSVTQLFINMSIWTEAFYMISAYLIALKVLENLRPKSQERVGSSSSSSSSSPMPNLFSFASKRYVRLVMPMVAFIALNYVWPRLSNGFVFQDQSSKLMAPCDTYGWTNMMLFHNNFPINETCLWPSHASATYFQLHLLSYPLIALCLMTLHVQFNDYANEGKLVRRREMLVKMLTYGTYGLMALIALSSAIYSALEAASNELIVPFLIDYIDYDNYQRVLEWMIMPTYNHMTSYMFGLALAFIVVQRKARIELAKFETTEWYGARGEGSRSPSVRSSSTQELQDGLTFKVSSHSGGNKFNISSGHSSISASSQRDEEDQMDLETDASLVGVRKKAWRIAASLLSFVLLLCTLTSSWLWNGLGQPMSREQTFWYVLLTKVVFSLTFAYLFHEHFATRRNSSNPWMITRFLVPVGRMSLTVFYMSWLVTWFDLLASLHQWHPSHYFIFEKYNEIIFMTLILSLFVYGAFEGIIKRQQYASRAERVKHDAKLLTAQSSSAANLTRSVAPLRRLRVKAFESFFDPLDKWTSGGEDAGDVDNKQPHDNNSDKPTEAAGQQQPTIVLTGGDKLAGLTVGNSFGGQQQAGLATLGNLSPSDRYKLNAELRANYSFASIGLYESAGATGDLTALNSADPRASPSMSEKR